MSGVSSILSTSGVRGAYQSSRELAAMPLAEESASPAESFSQVLSRAGQNAIDTVRATESVAQKGMTGEAGTQAVVEATLELESTVKVMVSMRDKMVEAYQEIMRMPI